MMRQSLLAVLAVAWCHNLAWAQLPLINKDDTKSSPKMIALFRDVVSKAKESTVKISADGKTLALGVIITDDGWVLTKASDIQNAKKVTVTLEGAEEYEAKLVGVHDAYDLAMLKIEATNLTPIQWHDAKSMKPGQWVASVGATSDPAAIGVVGVATRKLAGGDQPARTPGPNAAYLGVTFDDKDGSGDGARISSVAPGSAAAKAKLKPGDVIFEAAGQKVTDKETLIAVVQKHRPGDDVQLKVRRGDETVELTATLGRIPPNLLGNPQEKMGNLLSNRRGGFPTILQHDGVLLPKDCGGPLVDLKGRVVALNISRAGRTETYAIPAEDIQPLLEDLKSGKLAPKIVNVKVIEKKNPNLLLRKKGELTAKDPEDKARPKHNMQVFEVPMEAGAEYTIDLTSDEFDAFLRLEDAKGKKLIENDDVAPMVDLNSQIVFACKTTGTYRVIVTSFEEQRHGAFEVTVRRTREPKGIKTGDE